jgi:NAD(P)H dehydrogenase (quinone)
MRRALEEVRTLFLVSAGEAFDRVKLHTTAVGAVVAAGVERVVYLSFLNAAPDATFTFARDHFHTEEHVRSTGVRHALLRPSIYLYYATFFCTA